MRQGQGQTDRSMTSDSGDIGCSLWSEAVTLRPISAAQQQVGGADLAIENPFEAVLAFATLFKFDDTAPAARRLSSGRWAAEDKQLIQRKLCFFIRSSLSLKLTPPED